MGKIDDPNNLDLWMILCRMQTFSMWHFEYKKIRKDILLEYEKMRKRNLIDESLPKSS